MHSHVDHESQKFNQRVCLYITMVEFSNHLKCGWFQSVENFKKMGNFVNFSRVETFALSDMWLVS